jgi:hypothetical protein
MEILIHGTKGGYKVLDKTPNFPFSIARDVRRSDVANNRATIGQFAYSIAFADNGCVYSKYIGVWDIGRKAIGNIAFAVYIPNSKRIAGSDMKNLLDDLVGWYWQEYIIDGNLGNKQEDCTFVTALTNQYETLLRPVSGGGDENSQQGIGEAAYVYYSSNEELQKYFDAPFQEEYAPYRQIFFVEQQYADKPENPLNALQHDANANLTGKIELENPKYKLQNFSPNGKNGVTIELWVNDSKRSNNGVIYRKDKIRIKYAKDDRYFRSIEETGKIDDSNIAQYLFINGNKITVKTDVDLQKVEKLISLEVKDSKGNAIHAAEITCKNEFSNATKTVIDNQIHFEGEELKDRWTISATKDNLKAKAIMVIPEKQQPSSISLVLQEYKKVSFTVLCDDNNVSDYTIQIKDEKGNVRENKDSTVEFYGDDIHKSWNITIEGRNYQTETFAYCPANDENPKYVTLQKKQAGSVTPKGIDNEESKTAKKQDNQKSDKKGNGICRKNIPNDVNNESNYQCKDQCDESIENDGETHDGFCKAQLKWLHKKWEKVPIFLRIVVGVVVLVGLFFLIPCDKEDGTTQLQAKANTVEKFIKDHKNDFEQLQIQKETWEKEKDSLPKTCNFFSLGLGEREVDTTTNSYKEWEKTTKQIDAAIKNAKEQLQKTDELHKKITDYCDGIELNLDTLKQYKTQVTDNEILRQRVEACITLRENLNKGEVTKIKNLNFHYSSAQDSLKTAMNLITDANKVKVGNAMNKALISTMNLNKIADFIQKPISESSSNGRENNIKKDQLATTKDSLETKFWNLVNAPNETKSYYDNLYKKYKDDSKYKDSEIIKYLESITKDANAFGEFKGLPAETRRTATSLDSIKIN